MKRLLPVLLTAFTLLILGCGNNDDFVFTNTNANTGLTPGVATQLAFVQNPAQTTNTDFSTPPIVEVRDAFGNRVLGATNTITVSLVNPGTASLNGLTTRDAVDGQAIFTGLSVDEPGSFTLTCAATGLTGDDSSTFTVTPSLALFALAQKNGNNGLNPAQLIQLDPDTGEYSGTFGFLAKTADVDSFQDLVCLPDGTIYILAFDDDADRSRLVRVDSLLPPTFTDLGLLTDVDEFYSLAYDQNNQILYGIADDLGFNLTLCTINTTTLAVTLAPNNLEGDVPESSGLGLAFDDNTGTLFYADDDGGGELFTIDPSTGLANFLGNSSLPGNIKGMDFNPLTNTLLGVSRQAQVVGTINTSNGSTVETGFTPRISGIAYCENPTAIAGPARQTGYTVSGITQAFVDITGTGTNSGLGDDDNTTESIGFTFNFDGTDYTDIIIDSNGYVSFVATTNENEPELIPTDFLDNDTLLVWWDDLDPTEGGDIFFETQGIAPNRTFIVQYQVNHDQDLPGEIDCEIILYEGTNVIEFHYADVTFGDPDFDAGKSAVVGIQTDSTHADVWSVLQDALTDTTAIRFTP